MGILSQICKENDILLSEMNDELCQVLHLKNAAGEGGGYAVHACNYRFILYDGEAGRCEKEFIVAHELAHHLFGHLAAGQMEQWERNEQEANIFASVFVVLRLFREMEGVK